MSELVMSRVNALPIDVDVFRCLNLSYALRVLLIIISISISASSQPMFAFQLSVFLSFTRSAISSAFGPQIQRFLGHLSSHFCQNLFRLFFFHKSISNIQIVRAVAFYTD